MIILILILGWFFITIFSTVHFGNSRAQNLTPLGELTEGLVVQQQVPVKRVYYADTVCYDVLFATYRRVNLSTIQITLTQNNYKQKIQVDASKLIDNRTFPLCFLAKGFSDGKAVLEITGLNGKPGQSPTVWMTSDISYGGILYNGAKIKKSLVFQAYSNRNIGFFFNLVGIFFVLFGFILFLMLAVQNSIFKKFFASISAQLKEYFYALTDYQRLIFIFSVIALTMSFVMATVSKFAAHPDEALHTAAATYYENHNMPPAVGDPRANFTYVFTRYGVSYINQSGIDYFLIGKFNSFIKSIPFLKNLYSQRFFNIFLFLILCLMIWRSEDRLIFFPIIITPQVWYIASYTNNDFFPFFIMMVLCSEFLDKNSFYNRSLTKGCSIGFAFPTGVLLGILSISKSNYLVFVLFSIFYLFWNVLKFNQFQFKENLFFSQAFKVFLLVLICATSVYAIRTGFDIYQNGFDKNEKLKYYANQFAKKGFRPIDIEKNIQQTPSGLRLKEKGESLVSLLVKRDWHKISLDSFLGVYGWMKIKAPKSYYQWISSFLILMIIYAGIQSVLTFQARNTFFLIVIFSFICIMVLVSLYHSWTYDFQPQGRYLFPILGILSIFLNENKEYMNAHVLSLLISLIFILSFWSFLFIGIYHIDKIIS